MESKTLDLARIISEKPIRALKTAKRAIKESDELPLEQGIRLERKLFYPLLNSRGAKEGIKAFVDKREPDVNIEESTTE